ncbi:MAG: hypothetical protein IJX31_00175 [Clostridia bacterium]|nr:hypothetical protein [Clostridia bacterium]
MKKKKNDYMDDTEDIKNERPKKRRRWPFLFLGFFLGLLITIGSTVAAVVVLINNPVEKTVGTIDKVANTELYETLFGDDDDLGVLDASYAGKSLKDVIGEISDIAQKGSSLSFADLNEIFPKVETTLDDLIENLEEQSIVLDKDELFTTPLNEIADLLLDKISLDNFRSIELREFFDIGPDDTGILATLVNKKDSEGNYWTIGHLTIENINSLTIGEVLGDLSDNFYLKHLSDSTLKTLSTDINSLTVIELFEDVIEYKTDAQGNIVYENGHPVLKGTWKYLLTYNPDNPHSYSYVAPEEYAVTDMSKLIENMHNNIESATLHELHDDGVIPHLGEDANRTLDQKLLPTVLTAKANEISTLLGLSASQNITTMTIGDLTVLQVSDYLGFLLGEILNP